MRLRSGRFSSREETIIYYTKPKKNTKNTINPDPIMSHVVTINTNPTNEITNDIQDLITKESPSEKANLNKHNNEDQDKDNNKETKQNLLISNILLDKYGHNLKLDTTDALHSRNTLSQTFTTPQQSRDSPERKSSDTGTKSKEQKTPSRSQQNKKKKSC